MNKKLKLLLKVIDNVVVEFPKPIVFIESNMKEVSEGENIAVLNNNININILFFWKEARI